VPGFLFPKFFPKKNLAKKLGRVLQPEISGMVCVRVQVLLHPAPPFVQMKNTPGGRSRGADFQARHSVRAIDHWSVDRRLATSFMSRDGQALRCLLLILLRNLPFSLLYP
jgi:hypothetical protein